VESVSFAQGAIPLTRPLAGHPHPNGHLVDEEISATVVVVGERALAVEMPDAVL